MAWPDELSQDLPTPRDDEPATLRQDIIDELADHLQCAFNRELHTAADETKARQTVLDKFGDPARIAYRLWFDAMKEKIMSQRITLAAVIVLVAVCICMGAASWQIAQQNSQTSAALLEQSRELNAAMLVKLSSLAAAGTGGRSMEWNPAKLMLVSDAPNGAPAKGFTATLYSTSQDSNRMPELNATSDEDGVIDFGHVRYGTYGLNLRSPWGDATAETVIVAPGRDFSKTIICPEQPRTGEVSLKVEWPEELKRSGLWAACTFDSASPTSFWSGPSNKRVIVANDNLGTHYESKEGASKTKYFFDRNISTEGEKSAVWIDRPWRLSVVFLINRPSPAEENRLELPMETVAGYRFLQSDKSTSTVLSDSWNGRFFSARPSQAQAAELLYGDGTRRPANVKQFPAVEAPTFEVEPGKATTWTIKLPDELTSFVRNQSQPPVPKAENADSRNANPSISK